MTEPQMGRRKKKAEATSGTPSEPIRSSRDTTNPKEPPKEFPKMVSFRTDKITYAKFRHKCIDNERPIVRVMDDLLGDFIATHPVTGKVNEQAVEENAKKKHPAWKDGVSIHLREETHAHIKKYASENGTTIVAILNELISDYIDNQEGGRSNGTR